MFIELSIILDVGLNKNSFFQYGFEKKKYYLLKKKIKKLNSNLSKVDFAKANSISLH